MKVDGSLGSLLQGVSQQAPRDRLNGQCTLQENMSANPVDGLTRRPPTDLVGKLKTSTSVSGWHNFQTRDGRKFLAMYQGTTVDVFDLNATSQTVTVDADAVAYLTGTDNLRSITDDKDNTVVVNPVVTVDLLGASVVPYYNTQGNSGAIFQILGGLFGKRYSIYIDGTLAAYYETPDGSNTDDPKWSNTQTIASYLLQGLQTGSGTSHPGGYVNVTLYSTGMCAGWDAHIQDDVFVIKKPSGEFTASVGDGTGGSNFKVCTDTVTDVADLPRFAPHYYAIRIAENTEAEKDLWFKFIVSALEGTTTPDASAFGKAGYWQEAVAPDTPTSFDPATMPHKLAYDPDTVTFTFSRETYDPRRVGTSVSNPDPSFVDSKISDVANFQGRIVFLSGSNVIMSRTNRPTNFWRGSASALADTDPIDVYSKIESSAMLAAVQFNKDLVMFTRKAQHIVFGRTALTPSNAALVLTTSFESEPDAHPVASGHSVFFATNFGRFTGVREFVTEANNDDNDSRQITQHVNKYIVGKAKRLTSSTNYEMLAVHTDQSQSSVYMYQYIWSDENKKVQAAWCTWILPHDIAYSFFDEDTMYLVHKVGNDYYLLRMPLDVQDSGDCGYPVFLDQRFDVFGCTDAFVLPYDYLSSEQLVVVQSTDCPNPGLAVAIKSIENVPGTGYVVTLKRDMGGGDIIVGTRFMSRYMPTMPSVKDQNGVVLGTAKTRARSFLVSLDDTGYIAGRVRSKYGDGPEVTFNARIVGDIDNTVGEQPLSSEQFVLPYRQNVNAAEIELYSDSHLPMTLADIEYVGQYTKRGRRIANSNGGNN